MTTGRIQLRLQMRIVPRSMVKAFAAPVPSTGFIPSALVPAAARFLLLLKAIARHLPIRKRRASARLEDRYASTVNSGVI